MLEHIQSRTYHARRGGLKNSFHYGVDFVLSDFQDFKPLLISRNRFNIWSLWDRKHGGPRGNGRGVAWFRETLSERGFPVEKAQLVLLAQPSFLWLNFNPVSFWIATINGELCAFVAEVNNTFGHRHCYFCALDGFRPIIKADTITAEKLMHVSPFQNVAGQYRFNFGLTDGAIDIRISYKNGDQGVLATLTGDRKPATNASLLWAVVRRPLGAARVVALIYWQALMLFFKRAPFVKTPEPPMPLLSENLTFKEKKP